MLTPQGTVLLLDTLGTQYTSYFTEINTLRSSMLTLQSDQILGIGTSNPMGWTTSNISEAIGYQNLFQQATTNSNTLSASGVALGNFTQSGLASTANGFFQLGTAFYTAYSNSIMTGMNNLISTYSTNGATTIPTFLAATSQQANSAFASLYWYTQNGYMPANTVFAPLGINLGQYTITSTSHGTLTPGFFPTTNGYTTPAPTTDSWGNNLYVGGVPMAQGFAPCQKIEAIVSTSINGPLTMTASALNQSSSLSTWTGVLNNLGVGATVILTPSTSTNYCNSSISALSISGTASAGAFTIQTVNLR